MDCVGPVAFFIPSNMPLMFPAFEQVCISVQSCTHYLFAQHLAVCGVVFLAFLRSSSFCLEGHCLYFSKAVLFAVITGSISRQKTSTQSAFFLFPNPLMALSYVMLLMEPHCSAAFLEWSSSCERVCCRVSRNSPVFTGSLGYQVLMHGRDSFLE